MNDVRPIAVFDSGVGGISVLKELYALMPNENYIYYGDSKNAPYGSRAAEEVKRLVVNKTDLLVSMGAKALVVACNTATSVAVDFLREKYDVPVIGVEPALKPAVLDKENPTVAVMATPVTLHEEKFLRLTEDYKERAKIIPVPCPKLAAYVEKGMLQCEETEEYIKGLFLNLGRIDSVVLGCTHYPFVRKTIEKIVGPNVKIFDGGAGTARETKRRLSEADLLKNDGAAGKVTFLSSLDSEEEKSFCMRLFEL